MTEEARLGVGHDGKEINGADVHYDNTGNRESSPTTAGKVALVTFQVAGRTNQLDTTLPHSVDCQQVGFGGEITLWF